MIIIKPYLIVHPYMLNYGIILKVHLLEKLQYQIRNSEEKKISIDALSNFNDYCCYGNQMSNF